MESNQMGGLSSHTYAPVSKLRGLQEARRGWKDVPGQRRVHDGLRGLFCEESTEYDDSSSEEDEDGNDFDP